MANQSQLWGKIGLSVHAGGLMDPGEGLELTVVSCAGL